VTAPKLGEYRAKRDFRRTPEPAPEERSRGSDESTGRGRRGSTRKPAGAARKLRFVVHEHHARRLHWDLRLEVDGTLMSWAIPNGLPQDPAENRKAIHVEDHPLEYLEFEAEIPKGSYGAGRIVIWDRGSYELEKLKRDEVIAVFHGERLRGRYALFSTGGERDWMIHRMDPPERARDAMPEHVQPMLATPGELPPRAEEWAFEVKWDGVRAITYWRPGRMRLESRNLNDITSRYPELRAMGEALGAHEAILDGEIVAFDEHGKPSFELLQRRMHVGSASAVRRLARELPVTYMVFDVLYLDGELTTGLAYSDRRPLLAALGLEGAAWQTPAQHVGEGRELLAATAELGLEGVIAKRLRSSYRPGERSGDWLKIKNVLRQELVIGGWLPGKGARAGRVGALLVGYYEDPLDPASFRYAGRVGTGFDEAELELLAGELTRRAARKSPFSADGAKLPREAHFVAPELVAEVEFAAWTRDGVLRQSSYKGLRTDKPAREVVLETGARADAPRRRRRGRAADAAVLAESNRAAGSGDATAPAAYRVLRETAHRAEVEVEGRTLKLSNREKVLYPRAGFTKGRLIDYYAAIAPVLLPHLAARPLTMKRYPEGVEGDYFYEKRCPPRRPEWVTTAPIWSGRAKAPIEYCVVENLPTLMWAANLADIELHTSLSRASDMDTPTAMVFDLDPGAPAALRECCKVALWIREMLGTFGLETFAKTSGAKGLQVYVPLNRPVSYAQTKPFARAVAQLLERRHARLVVSRMTRSIRAGKVLIDWSQNDEHKTTVSVYSLRARERPTISTPLGWEEVERAARLRSEVQLSLEPAAMLERVADHGDLFGAVNTLTQSLPELES
jgi:bifunctional non-homologous end joining protein LigD